jgi:hypothetical protein
MPFTAIIQAPGGIQRLIDLGHGVASSSQWASTRSGREAVTGLWIDAALTRADLRGSAEVVGDRIQAGIAPAALTGDAAIIDRLCADWLDHCDAIAQAAGAAPTDNVQIIAATPRDVGAWGAIATIAVIAIVTGGGTFLGYEYLKGHFEALKRDDVEQARAAGFVRLREIADQAREQQRELTQAELMLFEQEHQLAMQANNNVTRPSADSDGGLFGLSTPTLVVVGALAALMLWSASRRRT